MGDIRRGVSWALERPCPLRSGENWTAPGVAARQLSDVVCYSRAVHEGMVVDDVCVTGYTFGLDSANNTVMLPVSGFRVSLAMAPFGGEEAVRATCTCCEANVSPDSRLVLAHCHGFLEVMYPDSEELEAELQERVSLKGLADSLEQLFPRTSPLWYGLWIESPLGRNQCKLLLELFEGMAVEGESRDDDLRHFTAALRVAVSHRLPLHVEMNAPGHGEGDYLFIFPHCPRCKAAQLLDGEDWAEPDAQLPVVCHVCQQSYVPAETGSHKDIDPSIWSADDLTNVIGPDNVEPFTRHFLAHRGCSPEQIDDVLDRAKNGPLKRRINDLRERQREARQNLPGATEPAALPSRLTLSLGGALTMTLRLIPAGEFLMGTDGPREEAGTEGPQHRVHIPRPFYLGEFPVTQAQYEAVMGSNPARFTGDSDRPVEEVSWFAAQEFCLRLSVVTGRWVRLPSEAEWEYACRAGTASKYHWGDEATAEQVNCQTGDVLGDFLGGGKGEKQEMTTNVQGRYPANAWGIFDMHGNVQEWCDDEWHDSYEGAPTDGGPWRTPEDENAFRCLRGGSCWHHATACTSASRQSLRADARDEPEEPVDDGLLAALFSDRAPVGFRVVVEAG